MLTKHFYNAFLGFDTSIRELVPEFGLLKPTPDYSTH